MAGYTESDPAALKKREEQLWRDLAHARAEVRRIEHEISMIQFGRIYEDEDRSWIPSFIRKKEVKP